MKRGEVRRDFLPKVSSKYTFFSPNVTKIDVSKSNYLANVQCLKEIPPLSTCLNLRAKLADKELGDSGRCLDLTAKRSRVFAVDIKGIGIIDRDGIQ